MISWDLRQCKLHMQIFHMLRCENFHLYFVLYISYFIFLSSDWSNFINIIQAAGQHFISQMFIDLCDPPSVFPLIICGMNITDNIWSNVGKQAYKPSHFWFLFQMIFYFIEFCFLKVRTYSKKDQENNWSSCQKFPVFIVECSKKALKIRWNEKKVSKQ